MAHEDRKKFAHVVTVVWGSEYLAGFLSVTLPSLLTEGNLPGFNHLIETRFIIYTTRTDRETIEEHNAFAKLARIMPVEFIEIQPAENKYDFITQCHNQAVAQARRDGAYVLFVCPDHLFSENSFTAIGERIWEGKKVVFLAGFRLDKDAIYRKLVASTIENEGVLRLTPKEVSSLARLSLHPSSELAVVKDNRIAGWPAVLAWPVSSNGRTGFLVRGFHLHPIMVDPDLCSASERSLDWDMIPNLNGCAYVETSMEEIGYMEYSRSDLQWTFPVRGKFMATICLTSFLWRHCKASHRFLHSHNIRLGHDIDELSWRAAEYESQRLFRIPYLLSRTAAIGWSCTLIWQFYKAFSWEKLLKMILHPLWGLERIRRVLSSTELR